MYEVTISIKLKYKFNVKTEAEAIEYAENVELPSKYKEDSFEIDKVEKIS